MEEKPEKNQQARVIKPHKPLYEDPISLEAGQKLAVTEKKEDWQGWTWVWCKGEDGRAGWVPDSYLIQKLDGYVISCDYDARELAVEEGETVLVQRFESGWAWCSNLRGESGWVPEENITPAK
jgi:hypothetical protein